MSTLRSSRSTGTCTRAPRERPITTTTTPTSTEPPRADAAVIAVERAGIAGLRRSGRLAPRILSRGETAHGPVVRAAFVPVQAGPLDGDHDRIRVHVGPGATLEIVPIAATLALPGRSRLDIEISVGSGGRLILDEPPLIVAEGADVTRRLTIALAHDAIVALRDVVVLGRAGEGRGRLDSVTRATLAGAPLLHDALRFEPAADDAYVALAPGHRVVGTACLLGAPGEPALAGPGALRRASGPDLPAVQAALQPFSIGTPTRLPHPVHEPS